MNKITERLIRETLISEEGREALNRAMKGAFVRFIDEQFSKLDNEHKIRWLKKFGGMAFKKRELKKTELKLEFLD